MKKTTLLIFILTLLINIGIADAKLIQKYEEMTPISNSISLYNVKEFHTDKKITYSYIKADLRDNNTSLTLLKSNEGSDILSTVSNLAKTEEDVVAALNADFFSVHSGNKGFSLGIEIKDGKLIESPINPSTMATISYIDRQVSMSYLDFHIMVVAPNWQYNEVRHLNKHTAYYGDILMYTSEFNGGMSPAPGGEVLEVVVSNNKIVEFRRNMPPVEIPKDGCVLVVSEGVNMFFANNFNVGDPIKFDYYITPYLSNADTAFGGGAMLVTNGVAVTDWSHVVAGNNPRSAIGIDKEGKTLYLVAVDGRQSSSLGMRMSHLSDLMVSLGCYTAVNLDGGGSTNMVASTLYNSSIHTVNSPSENRKVINAVGLTSGKSSGIPYGIDVKVNKSSTFLLQPVTITCTLHDENMRKVEGKVSLSSNYGIIDNEKFYPTVPGKVYIQASYQNIVKNIEINVSDYISGIEVPGFITLNPGESKSFDISVYDKDGNYEKITNTDFLNITSSNPSVIEVNKNKITAHGNGNAIITVSRYNTQSFISVSSGETLAEQSIEFENLQGSLKVYPSDVSGEFELSDKYAFSGKRSGKIRYNFETNSYTEDVARGVYYSLSDKPKIADRCDSITVKFYTETPFNHQVRAQFIDADSKLKISSAGQYYQMGQWQTLTFSVPKDVKWPLKLDSIYVLYQPGEAKDKGEIYLDNLIYKTGEKIQPTVSPVNVYADLTPGSFINSVKIGSLIPSADTIIEKYVNSTLSGKISAYESGALIGKDSGFKVSEGYNSLFININTKNGGINKTDSSQWSKLVSEIDKTNKGNIFILSEHSIFGDDDFENTVICDYLASLNKNVFVVTSGEKDSVKNIKGVYYFTTGNINNAKLNNEKVKTYTYLEIDTDTPSFRWISLF